MKKDNFKHIPPSNDSILYNENENSRQFDNSIYNDKKHSELFETLPENELFNIITSQSIFGFSVIQDNRVIFINDFFVSLMNSSTENLIDKSINHFLKTIHEEDKGKCIEFFKKIEQNVDVDSDYIEFRIKDDNDNIKSIGLWSQIKELKGKKSIFCYSIDITERNESEKELTDNIEKLQTLIENSSEVIVVFDINGILRYASNSAPRILGYGPEEVIGKYVFDFVHPSDKPKLLNLFAESIEGKIQELKIEFRVMHKDGSWRYVATMAKNMLNNPVINGTVINMYDITEKKMAEEKASYYEFHDPLTKLPNRELFQNSVDAEIKKYKSSRRKNEKQEYLFAIMCLGLDKFKKINSMYGPSIGDLLLQKVAQRLKVNFRETDLVSRFGGDTYMVLFTDIENYEDVIGIIQKTMNIFQDPFIIESNLFQITVSIGVCFFPHDGFNTELIVKNAESAMYTAKEQGRNTYRLFDARLNSQMLTRLQIENDLQDAIFHNHFQAYYQPKINKMGDIIGMESLIRWISPYKDNEVILPNSFIGVAEKNGMITDIGNIILFESCSQNKEWQDKGYPFIPVAVNISPYQFKQPNLVLGINNILKQTRLNPKFLELEITESGIMEDEEDSIKKLNELHDLGVKIAIDDFGIGYSSLSKLKDYPIDTLKIDRSFVTFLPADEKSSAIATTIIDLAHNLGFKVVAEGVETKEQLDFLQKNNCDFFQGFYFSTPLPSDEIEKKFKPNETNFH